MEIEGRFCRISQHQVDFSRPKVPRVYLDKNTTVALIHALFLQARTAPLQRPTNARERFLNKFSNRMRFTGRQNIIIWCWLLKNALHSFHIIARVAPIAPGV
jgi:hypothetical protein